MVLKNVLVCYKKSAYTIYFLDKKKTFYIRNKLLVKNELARFKKAHDEHYDTLKRIEDILSAHQIPFTKIYRGQDIDYGRYDLVITVGGDGTFLEGARSVKDGVLLGVNSCQSYSVGNFCAANANNFEEVLKRILRGNFRPSVLPRLRLKIDGYRKPVDFLNDILFCHNNPAAMSRYSLTIGRVKEEQRSSGVWVATATGSSGAIHSAGGETVPPTEKSFQYMPRELYWGGDWKYRLKGGMLSPRQTITITSVIRNGTVYVDGTHLKFPVSYGATACVKRSPCSLKVIKKRDI